MTEDEAKTKWCDRAMATCGWSDQAMSFNRHYDGSVPDGCYCIGSACMRWITWDVYIKDGNISLSRDKDAVKKTIGNCIYNLRADE